MQGSQSVGLQSFYNFRDGRIGTAPDSRLCRSKYHPARRKDTGGRTALYSAVEEAMRALADAEFGDTIYGVTDGGENLSAISQRRLVQNLITGGIRTFVFLVNTSDFKTPEEREGSQNIEQLAGQTGGIAPLGRKSG
jgi:hypothetical protein